MAMLAPVHVENFGRLFGSNQPISAHFTAVNSSDQLQRRRSSIFQEALLRDGECLARVLVGQRISAYHYEILRKLLPSHIPVVKTKIVSGKVIEVS
jgi:hypothetical protein